MKPFYEKELERIKRKWGKTNPLRAEAFTKQYLKQGFSDEDIWSLDVHLAKIILPRLKRYKEIAEKHIVIDFPLDEMIRAFEIYEEVNYDAWELKGKKLSEFNKGMRAFAKYFLALWW